MNPIKIYRHDYCNECDTERIIECYDMKNKPVNYTLLLDRVEQQPDIIKILDNRQISYFRCRKCNTIFNADWSKYEGLCVPLRDNIGIILFLNDLKKYNKPNT